jgi:hypothetical protein
MYNISYKYYKNNFRSIFISKFFVKSLKKILILKKNFLFFIINNTLKIYALTFKSFVNLLVYISFMPKISKFYKNKYKVQRLKYEYFNILNFFWKLNFLNLINFIVRFNIIYLPEVIDVDNKVNFNINSGNLLFKDVYLTNEVNFFLIKGVVFFDKLSFIIKFNNYFNRKQIFFFLKCFQLPI